MTAIMLVGCDWGEEISPIRALRAIGYEIRPAKTLATALHQLAERDTDVVVVYPGGLPDISSERAIVVLRATVEAPIIALTDDDNVNHTVRLLEAGADHCFALSISAIVVDVSIRNILRRLAAGGDPQPHLRLVVGGLVIDTASREATLDGRDLALTPIEFDLLTYLAARAGTVVTKRELLAGVWHEPHTGSDKTVRVHLAWLRRKLGESASRPVYLHTVRGVGVRLLPTPGARTNRPPGRAENLAGLPPSVLPTGD